MPSTDRPEPIRLVNFSLLLWALGIVGLCVPYALEGEPWVFAGFGLAAVTAGLAIRGLRRGEWIRPLFASLYVLALACIAAGPLAESDVWPAVGIVCVTVLSVGGTILHRLGPRS